ncbi:MAG: OmpA family protein [Cryobacterium sp.]|nr:OmpA family protein [Cryobacterium sp.]
MLKPLAVGVIGVGLISGLVGCSATDSDSASWCGQMDGWSAPEGSPSLVVVVDHTASTREGELSSGFMAAITKGSKTFSVLSVLQVEGAGAVPEWLVDNLALNNAEHKFGSERYKKAVENAASCVASRIEPAVPSGEGTDLAAAIQVAADRLAGGSGPADLLIDSDGLSNVGAINLNGVIADEAVDTAVSRLDSTGFKPDLSRVNVTFTNLGVSSQGMIPQPSVDWLRNFYVEVCVRAAAEGCDAPITDQGSRGGATGSRQGAPLDPQLDLPSKQFEFDDSEVRFQPNSTILSKDADKVLAQVAACVQDGSTLVVVGHSARTGDHAAEMSVSKGRAANVANRIIELAGNPRVSLKVSGVGATEPKSSDGAQPEDRRVTISVWGVCK